MCVVSRVRHCVPANIHVFMFLWISMSVLYNFWFLCVLLKSALISVCECVWPFHAVSFFGQQTTQMVCEDDTQTSLWRPRALAPKRKPIAEKIWGDMSGSGSIFSHGFCLKVLCCCVSQVVKRIGFKSKASCFSSLSLQEKPYRNGARKTEMRIKILRGKKWGLKKEKWV